MIEGGKEYYLFSVAETDGKVKINFSDILFAESDEIDPRNKVLVLKAGKTLTVMNYSFEELTALCKTLIRVNRSQAVCISTINKVKCDSIWLEGIYADGKLKEVTLSRRYKNSFHQVMELNWP